MSETTRMGLTDAEVRWLQENMDKDETAAGLVHQYQMIVKCPQDPGARGIFTAMLEDWRKSRNPIV